MHRWPLLLSRQTLKNGKRRGVQIKNQQPLSKIISSLCDLRVYHKIAEWSTTCGCFGPETNKHSLNCIISFELHWPIETWKVVAVTLHPKNGNRMDHPIHHRTDFPCTEPVLSTLTFLSTLIFVSRNIKSIHWLSTRRFQNEWNMKRFLEGWRYRLSRVNRLTIGRNVSTNSTCPMSRTCFTPRSNCLFDLLHEPHMNFFFFCLKAHENGEMIGRLPGRAGRRCRGIFSIIRRKSRASACSISDRDRG